MMARPIATSTELAKFGSQLRYFRQDRSGVSAARNLGVRQSRGRLIAFLDSDDLWQPDKLKIQVRFMENSPEVQICQTDEVWIRHGVRVNPRIKHRKPSGDIFERSLDLCLVSPSAVMMTRELFDRSGGFDESLPVCEDYDLWLRIARDYPVPLIEQPLGRQAWRPCRPAVPFAVGHGSLSGDRAAKAFARRHRRRTACGGAAGLAK